MITVLRAIHRDAADAARDPKLEVKLFRTGQQQEDRARAEINSRGHTPCDLEEAAWNQTLASGGTCRQDADCAVIPEEPYNIVTACNHATDLATLAKLAGILERKACSTALCAPIAVRCRTGRCARTP
jgi:hypothetical protein